MSCLSKEHRSLFIHVPKTAGTSLSAVSWNRGSGHDTVAEYEARGVLSDDLFVWAFVRNPWDRIASAYEDCPEVWPECPFFESFVRVLYAERDELRKVRSVRWSPGKMPRLGLKTSRIHFLPQNLLLRTRQGILRPNFIGRFENLKADFETVCLRLGVERETLPHRNSRHGKKRRRETPLDELYAKDATVNMVGEVFEDDCRFFNYQGIQT